MARLYVGLEGIALAEIARQFAMEFARDRRQGRSLNPRRQERSAPADNILVHPDVRRMALEMQATVVPLRGLAIWLGIEHEVSLHHSDPAVRSEAGELVSLLTPVLKSHGSARGFDTISTAMQLCGGAGYTRDWGIEQFMRDARIAMIYEGTNHVLALDLVGQLAADSGSRFGAFKVRIGAALLALEEHEELEALREALRASAESLENLNEQLFGRRGLDPESAAAVASDFLTVFAHTAMVYVWSRLVLGAQDEDQRADVMNLAAFYRAMILPEVDLLTARIREGKSLVMGTSIDTI